MRAMPTNTTMTMKATRMMTTTTPTLATTSC
jgi:hypothetical protein